MKRSSLFLLLLALGTLLAACSSEPKQEMPLTLAQLFTHNMVLQRDAKVPVWGTATPNEKVALQFRAQTLETTASEKGFWRIELAPEKAGLNDSLVVQAGTKRLVLNNLAVGEVWICSGQSNMEMNLDCNWARVQDQQAEVAAANHPNLRLFIVDRNTSFVPRDSLKSTGWQVATPATAGAFSATGYFFGRELLKNLDVPIGLIQTAWGGTVAEAWTSSKTLLQNTDFAADVQKIAATKPDSAVFTYNADMLKWEAETLAADPGYQDTVPLFAALELDDKDWTPFQVPGLWEAASIGVFDGTVWFRKHIRLTQADVDMIDTVAVAAPDDAEETFVNGKRVGASKEWNVHRRYAVPKGLLRVGDNVITVRLIDFLGGGGFMGDKSHFYLSGTVAGKPRQVPIHQGWVCKKGYDLATIKTKPISPYDPNQPTVLFNAMVNPLVPFAFRGVIWYQGESNSGRAYQYRRVFQDMITDWRSTWAQGDFPFLFVQLANYRPGNAQPVEDDWAELREAQALALQLPNTGMASAIDIGDPLDIHPANKQDVGRRLALVARHQVYADTVACYGPSLKEMRFSPDSSQVTLLFQNTFGGLATRDGKAPRGFAVAAEAGKFQWATASLQGNEVVLSAPRGTIIRAVRYAWSSNPDATLINAAGLPAPPFRTDSYKGITQP